MVFVSYGTPSLSSLQNPEVNFSPPGNKTVILKITDFDGFSCATNKTIRIGMLLPRWREVTP